MSNLNIFLYKCAVINILLSLIQLGDAQNYFPQNVPTNLVSDYYKPNYKGKYYKLHNVFKLNKKILTGIDDTDLLQEIVNKNDNIILPDEKIYINAKGLFIGSNKKIIFNRNTQIIYLGPADGKLSDILKIYNAQNVEIINPIIIGSKFTDIEQKGQWSAGISVLNSFNVKILNPKITNTFGDGIFIGSENGEFSENILLSGGWIDNARRNGISVTSGKNVIIQNVLVSNTFGHDPEGGLDIEASWNKDILQNILVKNLYTFNNSNMGISINLDGLATEKDSDSKFTSIIIDGHTDFGSRHALLTSLNTLPNTFDTKGTITVKNAKWINTRNNSYWKSATKHRISLKFSKIRIDDKNKSKEFFESIKNTETILVK